MESRYGEEPTKRLAAWTYKKTDGRADRRTGCLSAWSVDWLNSCDAKCSIVNRRPKSCQGDNLPLNPTGDGGGQKDWLTGEGPKISSSQHANKNIDRTWAQKTSSPTSPGPWALQWRQYKAGKNSRKNDTRSPPIISIAKVLLPFD